MNANESPDFCPTDESGIPTQQTACLCNKSLKALSVWHFLVLLKICCWSQRCPEREVVWEEFNHEKSFLNLFHRYSVSWQSQGILLAGCLEPPVAEIGMHAPPDETNRWCRSEIFHFLLRNLKRWGKIRITIDGEKISRFLIITWSKRCSPTKLCFI